MPQTFHFHFSPPSALAAFRRLRLSANKAALSCDALTEIFTRSLGTFSNRTSDAGSKRRHLREQARPRGAEMRVYILANAGEVASGMGA